MSTNAVEKVGSMLSDHQRAFYKWEGTGATYKIIFNIVLLPFHWYHIIIIVAILIGSLNEFVNIKSK